MKNIFKSEFIKAAPIYSLIIAVILFFQLSIGSYGENIEQIYGLGVAGRSTILSVLLISMGWRLFNTFFTSKREIVLSLPIDMKKYILLRALVDYIWAAISVIIGFAAEKLMCVIKGIQAEDMVWYNLADLFEGQAEILLGLSIIYLSVIVAKILSKKKFSGVLVAIGFYCVSTVVISGGLNMIVRTFKFQVMTNINITYSEVFNALTGTVYPGGNAENLRSLTSIVDGITFISIPAVIACFIIAGLMLILAAYLTEKKVEA